MRVSISSISIAGAFAGALTLASYSTANAQAFGNEWVTFKPGSATHLSLSPTQISDGNNEVDLAAGDLDKNGFADLLVARKQPFTTPGKRTNILFMNYNGVLTDMTAQFATASDVPGDQGFLTPTNDRDVITADIDNDGWLDVITSVVISFGDPKHISHPRVYHNLGNDAQGNWLGLRFENARIPQLLVFGSGIPTGANGCAVAAGDINNDGSLDLYIVDYDNSEPSGQDLQDRLLINDGFGFFTDESQLRLTPQMLDSGFGTSGYIVDLNGDGANDILRSQAGPVNGIYNNPANVGHYNILDTVYSGSGYFVQTGDLNNDGRLDICVGDDSMDRYRYNMGNDALGRVIWGPQKPYTFLAGGDDGFGNQSLIVDLDNDGWNDVVQTDVDVDIGGCSRRTHIYHNPGGTPGSQITLLEERENATSTSWLGAGGLKQNDLTGTYNSAVLDIDNDGDLDLVLGRCSGTYVWINDTTKICQTDIGFGGPGGATLSMCGPGLSSGTTNNLVLKNTQPGAFALLVLSIQSNPVALPPVGGTLAAFPIVFTLAHGTDAQGSLVLPFPGGNGPVSVYAQYIVSDTSTPSGYGMSNALRLDFLP